MNDLYKGKTVGNCGCTKCGLRGSSKNVASRNVFAVWPEHVCEGQLTEQERVGWIVTSRIEQCMSIRTVDEHTYYALAKHMEVPFSQVLKDAVKYQFTDAMIDVIMCEHSWEQDEGTATV